MTVSSTTNKVSYAGNGSIQTFPYGFKIFSESDLLVVLRAVDGTETVQALNSDYTVTGAGEESGGNVVMTTAPASGETLVIKRILEILQETDYPPNDPFPAESHEGALDRLTMISQQMEESVERSIKFAVSLGESDIDILEAPVAGKSLKYNSGGTGLENTDNDLDAVEDACVAAQVAAESARDDSVTAKLAAQAAQSAAETAQGAAELAETHAETAETNAETAQGLAETAQTGAETAQGLAETAQTGAETAQGLAETAQTGAETAQGLAETAQTGAETAQGLAETAETNAETAQGLAEAAQSAAEAAQGLAETAQTGAEAAEELAEKWAENPENTEVTTGKYSALHWAAKAQDYAEGTGAKLLNEQSAPVTDVDQGAVYTKEAGGQTELFFREESSGDEVQITAGGGINVAGRPNLTNLLYPTQSGHHRDIHRSGWNPAMFNQQWGGAQFGMELVDGATGVLHKFDVASGYVDTNGNDLSQTGYSTTYQYTFQKFKVSEAITCQAVWIKLYKYANPTDNLGVFIYSDNAGVPNALISNGTATAQAGTLHTRSTNGNWYRFVFATPPSLAANTVYHIVLNRSGAVDSVNNWALKCNSVSKYPYGGSGYGSNVPAWTATSSSTAIFLIESASATQFLQTGGIFDSKMVFAEGSPLNQSKGLTQPLKNFFDHQQGSFLIRGASFTKDKTIADFQYGLDHDRIVVRCNVTTGYAQVDLYESDGTKVTVTGTTDISAAGPFDIGVRYRAKGDGADFLTLYINGASEGTPLTSQTLTLDPLMTQLGTGWLGGGFALAPTWTGTYDGTALPSASTPTWTYAGTATEAAHAVVSGGKLFQQIVGSTDTCYWTYASASLNNTNGWIIPIKLKVVKSVDSVGVNDANLYIDDGTKRCNIYFHTYFVEVESAGVSRYIQIDSYKYENVFLVIGKGTDLWILCNGKVIYDGTGMLTTATSSALLQFGELTGGASNNAEVIYDYLKYYNTAAVLPQFTSGSISEFGFWSGDMSGIFSALYNSGTRVSIKSYCGVKENYVKWVKESVKQEGMTSGPTTASTSAVLLTDMERFVIGENFDTKLSGIFTGSNSGNSIRVEIAYNGILLPSFLRAYLGTTGYADYKPITVIANALNLFGLNKIEGKWSIDGNTATTSGTSRTLLIQEVE